MTTATLREILNSLPLRSRTPDDWTACVTANMERFLADHASCERKAHAAAMMLVRRYPEYPGLATEMTNLAREELEHFQAVCELLSRRSIALPNDEADTYVKSLLSLARHPRQDNLLDRLLIVALIEARSCERFCLLALALPDGELRDFYINFAIAEGRHFPLFVGAATKIFGSEPVDTRLSVLLDLEADIANHLPIRPAVH